MSAVRSAPVLQRAGAARLSVAVRYRPCGAFYMEGAGDRGSGGSHSSCPGQPPSLGPEWAGLGARIAAASQLGVDRDALHSAAVMDLLAGAAGNSLDRSISFLEMTARLDPASADVLTDLAAAYMTRADRDDDARSIVAALDAALRALRLSARDPAAQFNAALAMYRLGLYGLARQALDAFTRLEPRSPWADEARVARQALADPGPALTDSAWNDDSVEALVRRHPSDVRTFAWNWLAGWGDSWRAGRLDTAGRWLERAGRAGDALARTGDSSLAEAVAAIHRADAAGKAALAAAHRNYADGLAHARAFNAARADSAFAAARRAGERSPSLTAWAWFSHANNLLALGRPADCERELRQLLAQPIVARDRALAARAWWTLGVVLLRDRRSDEGRGMIERSRVLFVGLGDREYATSMVTILAEVAGLGNDARKAHDEYADALIGLRDYPRSVWRHNSLLLLARAATSDGMAAAGDAISEEDAMAVALSGRPTSAVEVQLARARQARDAGSREGVVAAMAEGTRLAHALPEGAFRTQLETELGLISAAAGVASPADAPALLDSSVARFTRLDNYAKLLDALRERAHMALRDHDHARAERDLDAAVGIYADRRTRVASPVDRSLLERQAHDIVDDLTMLRVERGDAAGALAARERVRSASVRSRPDTSRRTATIEYAMVRDTLVALVALGGRVHAERTPQDGGLMAADIELAVAALERRADEAVWAPPLERLWDRLVAPVLPQLDSETTSLTIITDGMLGRVPFAALRDPRTGEWLVNRFTLRFASSVQMAAGRASRASGPPRRALVVGEPVIDRTVFPWLGPLASATREMQAVSRVLPGARMLRGGAVDRPRLRDALDHTELFHFAGHAVFDDARPERSVLVVAPRGISAADIASLRLPTLRLVVLSACETDRSPSGAGAGFLGLAESFLAAGVGGVVGSLWRVDDAATAAFMDVFYQELSHSWGDPAGALARAQRSMAMESPASWAAFRYAGR